MSDAKQLVKEKLLEFHMSHMGFDDKNPRHVEEAEMLLKDLRQKYGWHVLVEAIEELRDESERMAAEARERFYEAVRRLERNARVSRMEEVEEK
jgi:hypothetical protein